MIDLIYILGRGSVWQNKEILYSLRSVEKHLKNYGKVFVVGKKPDFFNDEVIEIPYMDAYTNKARNIMLKILAAANHKEVSNNFILFNDDYFLLKDISAVGYPFYYKCDLNYTVKIQWNDYQKHAKATLLALQAAELPINNFDTHYPIVYNKEKFKLVVSKYNWEVPYGYIMKSTYCNTLKIPGDFKVDCKISGAYQTKSILNLNAQREMFSTADMAMNQHMKKYIEELYPNKSKYER